MEVGITKDFVEVPFNEHFIQYAAGYATALVADINTDVPLGAMRLSWLYTACGSPEVPYNREQALAMCKFLIDRYTLQCITKRFCE